jgi:hypothetical protein
MRKDANRRYCVCRNAARQAAPASQSRVLAYFDHKWAAFNQEGEEFNCLSGVLPYGLILKTAKSLALTLPSALLSIADEVIE